MTRKAKITSNGPATDGALCVADALLNTSLPTPSFPGDCDRRTVVAAMRRDSEIGPRMSAARSRWRLPDCSDSGANPLPSRIADSIKPHAGLIERHLHPRLGSSTHAVELLPTACVCTIQLGSAQELGRLQRERSIGFTSRRKGCTNSCELTHEHNLRESPAPKSRATRVPEPFNGGPAKGAHPRHSALSPNRTSSTLKYLYTVWEIGSISAAWSSGTVAVGVIAAKQALESQGMRSTTGVPGISRYCRPRRPAKGEQQSDRVGVMCTGEKFLYSLFQWTHNTETRDLNAPPLDDLPVVDVTGRPRMFQEEAIHGSVEVRSRSRMVRRLFGELPRDRARCTYRVLRSSRTHKSRQLTLSEPSRHQGSACGAEFARARTSELNRSACCRDGAASLHKLGVGAFVHTNDLDGNGDVDGAALFLQLGARC